MKKLLFVLSAMVFVFTYSIGSAQGGEFDIRLGINYPDAPERIGFDSQFSLLMKANQYLAVGVESGFGWIRWKEYTGTVRDTGPVSSDKTELTDAYSVPVLGSVRLGMSHMRNTNGIEPFVTLGAGYSWTFFKHPDDDATYGGFTWQVLGGVAFILPETNMDVIVDAGYRGATLYDADDYELDMSGFVAHVGVRFKIGGGNGDYYE